MKKIDLEKMLQEEINSNKTARAQESHVMSLDDTQRVKVLSPGRLVFNRFVRNKLAIIGTVLLLLLFAFSFLGSVVSPYGEKEVFHTNKEQNSQYGEVLTDTDYNQYRLSDLEVNVRVTAQMTSTIKKMLEDNLEHMEIADPTNTGTYFVKKLSADVFALNAYNFEEVGRCDRVTGRFNFTVAGHDNAELRAAVSALENGTHLFEVDGRQYKVVVDKINARINSLGDETPVIVASRLIFHRYDSSVVLDSSFKAAVVSHITTGESDDLFELDGVSYKLTYEGDAVNLFKMNDAGEWEDFALLAAFTAQRYTGEDSLSVHFKRFVLSSIAYMNENNLIDAKLSYDNPTTGEKEEYSFHRNNFYYQIFSVKSTYLIDTYARPSSEHPLGTDANGMDVLTRMMYGGRISLMVGFIVVIMEVIIGIILGGISGYFGGWIDTLLMRVVEFFNCLPFTPILIMLGAIFDTQNVDPYLRLVYMMIAMGVMGWTGVARMVRGQILSLREQEFMVAAEATGLKVRRRIFTHLVPNVMPQLIVTSTMGLGAVILTESTLSFLGLGAKYPIATWGAMINQVKDGYALLNYTYIWIPVGLCICLAVIAFNFVGDGLRDAFDPKMKR